MSYSPRTWSIDDRLAHWHPVALCSDLKKKPLAVTVCGVPVALYRTPDDIRAVYDRCIHRRAPLSIGRTEGQNLVCVYHGCYYDGKGRGFCPSSKSRQFPVPRFETQVLRNTIWIRSSDAVEHINPQSKICPALTGNDFKFAGVINKYINAPLQLVVDNMTELEHTGEVHRALAFGIDEYDTIKTDCHVDGDTVVIDYSGQQRHLPFFLRALTGIKPGDYYVQSAQVSFTPPHAFYDITWEGDSGSTHRDFSLRFVIYYTPITKNQTQLFAYVFWFAQNSLRSTATSMFAPILKVIVSQELERDKAIIEALPPDEARIEMFRLNKFDRPLALTRTAMARLYPEKDRQCQQANK